MSAVSVSVQSAIGALVKILELVSKTTETKIDDEALVWLVALQESPRLLELIQSKLDGVASDSPATSPDGVLTLRERNFSELLKFIRLLKELLKKPEDTLNFSLGGLGGGGGNMGVLLELLQLLRSVPEIMEAIKEILELFGGGD